MPEEQPTNPYSATEQPEPQQNEYPAVWDLVIKDIHDRDEMGLKKYKTRLQPFNGRDVMTDLYQELLDAVVYMRQSLYERDSQTPTHEKGITWGEGWAMFSFGIMIGILIMLVMVVYSI